MLDYFCFFTFQVYGPRKFSFILIKDYNVDFNVNMYFNVKFVKIAWTKMMEVELTTADLHS